MTHARAHVHSGQAGGEWQDQHIGGDSVFTNTTLSKWGDMGSKLPPNKLMPRWVAGSQVEVAWGPRFNVRTPRSFSASQPDAGSSAPL